MKEMERIFGASPRVRILAALQDFEGVHFTIPELRQEAGMGNNIYRDLRGLLDDGWLAREGTTRFRLRVNNKSNRYRLLRLVSRVLDYASWHGYDSADVEAMVSRLERAASPHDTQVRLTSRTSTDPDTSQGNLDRRTVFPT